MRALQISARLWVPVLFLAGGLVSVHWAQPSSKPPSASGARLERATVQKFVTQHCTSCHDGDAKKAGLDLDALSAEDVEAHPDVWEKVVRKLAGASNASRRQAAAGRADVRVVCCRARSRAGPRGRRAARSRPNSDPATTEPHRIPERHPRSPGAGRRRRGAAAGGRSQSRLRQRPAGRSLADASGPLPLGGSEDQPAGGRPGADVAQQRHLPHPAGSDPGRTRPGASPRHARRHFGFRTPRRRTANTTFRSG